MAWTEYSYQINLPGAEKPIKRKTHRTYTHAIQLGDKVVAWCGSLFLAHKALGQHGPSAKIVPVNLVATKEKA